MPLYSDESASVEALHDLGAPLSCNTAAETFCPDEPMSRADYVRLVQFMEAKKFSPIDTAVLRGDMRPQREAPITREEAAMVLYAAVKQRASHR